MKKLISAAALVLLGVVVWRVTQNLSSDAISMALGMFLGIVSGIPMALLLLASDRRSERPSRRTRHHVRHPEHPMMMHGPGVPQQPPVIIVSGAQPTLPPQSGGAGFSTAQAPHWQESQWPMPYGASAQPSGRTFRIVGEPAFENEE